MEEKQYLSNLSKVLAHSIVYEASKDKPMELYNIGGDAPPVQTVGGMLQDFTKYLPDYSSVVAKQMLPLELAQARASAEVSPIYTQNQLDIYNKYGPELNRVGQDIARSNALAQAQTEADVMRGPGTSLVQQGRQLSELVDPEYYKGRAAIGGLFDALNRGYTGSDIAEIRRSQAQDSMQRGTSQNPGNLNALENALSFGSQLANKRQNLANTIGTASAALTPLKSGVDPFAQATGRSAMPNAGEQKFVGSRSDAGSGAMNLGTNLFGSQTQTNNAAMQAQAQNASSLNQMIGSMVGRPCCFIFMESYNGLLPWWIRRCRDAFYTPTRRLGYTRMSKILVPMMEKSKFIRGLVNELMIAPLSAYGGYLHQVPGYSNGRVFEFR